MRKIHRQERLFGGALCLFLSTCVFLAACGGGGGGEPPAPPVPLDIGVHSSTTASQVGRSFLNPHNQPATVSAPPGTSVLAFGPANMGTQVGAFGTVSLDIVFSPTGSGPVTEIVTLRWTSGSNVIDQRFEITATGEAFDWTATPDPVDFGDVLVGDAQELEIRVRNNSQRSPVTFTAGTLPTPAFTFVGSPFPQTVQPGLSAIVRVRFAPTAVANQGGILRLGPDDVGGPVDVPLWANSSGSGEKVIDFGNVSLDGAGQTPELALDVPSDAVSITLEGRMSSSAEVGLRSFTGPGGKVYENTSQTGPLLWAEARTTFSTHIPSTDGGATQLVAGGGTYTFRLYRFSGAGSTMDVRAIIERRANGNANTVLPLNIFLAPGIAPTAATAETDTKLQGVVDRLGQVLETRGVTLGNITYYDIANGAYDNISQGEEVQLFQTSQVASRTRLNLFLVQTVWGGQLLGLAGAIDGARRNGDGVTGVVLQYIQLDADTVGMIAAHEICHYLGLWHTVESTGTWDLIGDTVQCPAAGTDATCSIAGGGLLMHWQLLGGSLLTPGQGLVIRGHAHMHPPGQQNQKIGPRRQTPLSPEAVVELGNLPPGWCGTRHR